MSDVFKLAGVLLPDAFAELFLSIRVTSVSSHVAKRKYYAALSDCSPFSFGNVYFSLLFMLVVTHTKAFFYRNSFLYTIINLT